MKCPYCGGEVASQALKCPFCDRDNLEGIRFQEQINQKIERNKLLKPFLIKQKTPELKQRMLTRIWFILIGVNVTLFVFALGIYLWSYREVQKEIIPGSYAEKYHIEFGNADDYYFNNFYEKMQQIVVAIDNKEMLESYTIESVVDNAYRALEGNVEKPEYQEFYQYEIAFFRGYLGLTEEACSFMEPDEEGKYDYYNRKEACDKAVAAIEEVLKERIQ